MPERTLPKIDRSRCQQRLFNVLCANLVARRNELGMSQRALARHLGVAPSWVSNWECCYAPRKADDRRRRPSLEALAEVAEVLKCLPADLLMPGRFAPPLA